MITHMPLDETLGKVPAGIEIPPDVRAILHAFLSKEPKQRFWALDPKMRDPSERTICSHQLIGKRWSGAKLRRFTSLCGFNGDCR